MARLPRARDVRGDSLPGERPEESTAPQRIAAIGRIQPEDGLSWDPTAIVAHLDVD